MACVIFIYTYKCTYIYMHMSGLRFIQVRGQVYCYIGLGFDTGFWVYIPHHLDQHYATEAS